MKLIVMLIKVGLFCGLTAGVILLILHYLVPDVI